MDRIHALFGLDQPLGIQYLIYLKNMITGKYGISITYRTDVGTIIAERMGNTVALLALATVLIIVIGIGTGVIAAMRRGSTTDKVLLVASMTGWSLPTFWTGLLMIVVFGVTLNVLPVSGILTPGAVYTSTGAMLIDYLRHLIMPTIALIIVDMAEFFLITRSTLVDVMTEDFILTAKGKGLSEKKILWRHALPNSMLPIVTTLALYVSLVIGGAIQVETVFSFPGMGQLMYDAVLKRDYPILEASFFLFATVTLVANFISDILYMLIDPRVKEL
ncbi:MAG: ABC transporter permease [Parasporobacterium sp.]|nr:ABC transporter permease [Parasporobacterium sp.]